MTTTLGGILVTINGQTWRLHADPVVQIALGFTPPSLSVEDDLAAGTKVFDVTITNGDGDGTFAVLSDPTGKFGTLGGTGTARTVSLSADLTGTAADTYTLTYRYSGDSRAPLQVVDFAVQVTISIAAEISAAFSPAGPSIPHTTGADSTIATLQVTNGAGDGTLTITSDPSGEFEVNGLTIRTKAAGDGLDIADVGTINVGWSYSGDSGDPGHAPITGTLPIAVYDATATVTFDTISLTNLNSDASTKTGKLCFWGTTLHGPTEALYGYNPAEKHIEVTPSSGSFHGGVFARRTGVRSGLTRLNLFAGVLDLGAGTVAANASADLALSIANGAETTPVTNPMTWAQWLAATTTEDVVISGDKYEWEEYGGAYQIVNNKNTWKILGQDATADFAPGTVYTYHALCKKTGNNSSYFERFSVNSSTYDGSDTTIIGNALGMEKQSLDPLQFEPTFYLRSQTPTPFSVSLRTNGIYVGKSVFENDAACCFRVRIPVDTYRVILAHVYVWKSDSNALSGSNICGTGVKLGLLSCDTVEERLLEAEVENFTVAVNGVTKTSVPQSWRWIHKGPNWLPFSYRRVSDGAVYERFYWLIGESGSDQLRYTHPVGPDGTYRNIFMDRHWWLNMHPDLDLTPDFSTFLANLYPDGIGSPVQEPFRHLAIGATKRYDTSGPSDRPDIGCIPGWDISVIQHPPLGNLDFPLVTSERIQGMGTYKYLPHKGFRPIAMFTGTETVKAGSTAGGVSWPVENKTRGRAAVESARTQDSSAAGDYFEEDEAHAPSPFFLAYLLTGSLHHLENHLALVSAQVMREPADTAPGFNRAMYRGQNRSAGWTLGKIGQLMAILPDDDDGSWLGTSDMGRAAWEEWNSRQWSPAEGGSVFGRPANWGRHFFYLSTDLTDVESFNHPVGWDTAVAWQDNFIAFGVAHSAELDSLPTDFDSVVKATYIHMCNRAAPNAARWCTMENYPQYVCYWVGQLGVGTPLPDCWIMPNRSIEHASQSSMIFFQFCRADGYKGYKHYPGVNYTVTDLGGDLYKIDFDTPVLSLSRGTWYTDAAGPRGGFPFAVEPVYSGGRTPSSTKGIGFIVSVDSTTSMTIRADPAEAPFPVHDNNSISLVACTPGTYTEGPWLPTHPLDYGDHQAAPGPGYDVGGSNKNYTAGARGSIEVWEDAGLEQEHPNFAQAVNWIHERLTVTGGKPWPPFDVPSAGYAFQRRSLNP